MTAEMNIGLLELVAAIVSGITPDRAMRRRALAYMRKHDPAAVLSHVEELCVAIQDLVRAAESENKDAESVDSVTSC